MKPVYVMSSAYTDFNKESVSCGHMLLVILTEKKSLERFTKRNCKKQIKKSLELKSNKKKR